jgi:hypothetical protein
MEKEGSPVVTIPLQEIMAENSTERDIGKPQ